MNRISDISYEKGLIDRMFGCGTLVVSDASEQGLVPLKDIPHGGAGAAADQRRAVPPATAPTRLDDGA